MKDPQDPQDSGLDGIAIVGMAARYPQARDVAELWRNLRAGTDCVSRFAEDELETGPAPEDPRYVRARGVLEDPDLFDAGFFDIPPRQAELMDPQNRLFLESAWQALEDAGVDPQRFPGAIGVFGGVTLSTYFLNNLLSNPELLAAVGSYQVALATDRDYLTTFVSYKLGLRGPSLDVQTACSTSLVATVLACQSLLGYQCDLALAGGVSVKVPQKTGYLWHPGGLDSSDGYCRAFDAGADGSVYGSGVGVVALKRLEDALADGDEIYAVIRGAALNNDGSARVGFTAPGVEGQAEVITTAQALAGVDPESIGYVECHGSGTALGDPIEVAALTKAFRANGSRGRGFCAIGSIKTNVGHCSAAAGVAGLIKASLALRHREIPPSLHFQAPNPAIDFASSPFYVADRLIPWAPNGAPRRAGVSSFGLGGTNAHVVLEEAPEAEPSGPSRPWQLLLLSARSEAALEEGTDRLAADLGTHPDRPLADVAFTTQVGRRAFAVRRALVCRDAEDARQALTGRDPRRLLDTVREPGKRPVAFLFPGVGDHYVGMARGLYETEPTFREHFDRCAELLKPRLGVDLREVVFAEEGETVGEAGTDLRRLLGRAPQEESEAARRLHRTLYAQPAVFAVDYALARLWMSWGIRPAALLGYSLGEYVAACLAGVLSLEDALLLVAERARLLDGLPPGAMLAVPLDEVRVRELIAGTDLDLAAVNGPGLCVVAGPEESVAALRERLAAEDVPVRLLPGTHAFHSRQMEPVVEALTRIARGLRFAPPKIPFVSNVTGTWITPAEATDPAHWARHLVGTVWFASGIAALWEDPARVLLEVGPGFGLSTLALQAAPADGSGERLALPSLRNQHERQPDEAFLLGALARLWLAGVEIDWTGFSRHEQRHRARLPGYAFDRQRYWVETRGVETRRGAAAPSIPRRREVVADGLTGDAFEQARAAAPGTRLVLVEDEATVRLIARLRELEALGAEVVVASAATAAETVDEAPPAEPARLVARHARPRLRNAWVEPAGEMEQWVAGVFEELLGIGGLGAHDSFFELGGHSLLATRLAARLRDRFGIELPLGDLFAAPTPGSLAARLQAERPAETASEPPLVPVPHGPEVPLAHAQQRLWFLDRLLPGNPAYILPAALRLTGHLDVPALRAALREIVRRHEALQVTFALRAAEPVQVLPPEPPVPGIPEIDLRGVTGDARETELRRLLDEDARRPFDLQTGPLLRATLVRLADGEQAVLFALHHIVSDAWSLGVLVREVGALYSAFAQGQPSPLPELPLQYLDYVVWQREHLGSGALERQIAWWREQLAGAPELDLPADHRRTGVPRFRGDVVSASLPQASAARFRDLCRSRDATLFMGLLAVFETLLARWSGQDDLVVGTTIANRRHSELEGLIGLFVNTLALRADLAGDPPFGELLERVRGSMIQAYEHQDVPFERLVAELGVRRDAGRTPLFQVLFQVQNAPAGALELPGLTLAYIPASAGVSQFDLVVSVGEGAEGTVTSWRYDGDLFEKETVTRLLGHFLVLLDGAAADPDLRLSDLPLLTDEEQHQLLHVWNPEPEEEPERFALHERLAERAAERPQAVAITDGGEALTYAGLEARSNRIANLLVDEGVRPGDVVALALERSADLVAAIVGVLKTGAAYLPLDPAYPLERLAFSLQDAAARALVTRSNLLDRLPEQDAPALLLDQDQERLERAADTPPEVAVTPDFPAYVIYTSGSTGRPKGVVVTHGQVARLFTSTDGWFGFSSEDVWTLFHSYAFDFSVWEIWGALLTGGRLVIVPALTSRAPDAFLELLRAERVTVLNQTPSAFRQLMRVEGEPSPPAPLRLVLFGGEALDPATLTPWFARHGDDQPRLVNMYGITETTVHVTYRPLGREDAGRGSVIGRPIPDLTVHLLDRAGRLVPMGVPGEICVGGAGVTLGYLGRPDLTAERFVPDPFGDRSGSGGARLYRSGDLARRTADGDLEYLGRIDHQVKIRGFRIELGEIEAALATHPAVREAVAVVRQDGGDEPRLVAYVVPRDGEMPAAAELRSFLKGSLPEHMLPAVYVPLERLPLTANGKVDRRSLPEPEPGQTAMAIGDEPPRTDLEARLAELWREALRVERIGIHDDFFALGGSSITAALMVNRMQEELGGSIPVVAIFEAPTVAGFAAWLERELPQAAAVGAVPPLRPYPWAPGEPVPLSFAQERLWFLDQLDGASPTYNIPAALRLAGRLDAAVLDRVLTEIVRRHAALRTRFSSLNGRPVQVIEPPAPFPVPRVDLSGLGPERAELEARRLAVLEAACSFDLTRGPLLRAVLLRLGGEDHAVLFNLHHIVGDGWSMGVLTRELAVLHEAFTAGRPSPLPELPVQYADYARWQRAWLRGEVLAEHLAWWRERLAGAPVLQLPTDRPRPPVQTFRGAARGFVLPPRLADELAVLGRGRGATLFMTLLAAFAALLQRHTGQDDVSVGSPVAGRPRAALEDLIGFFVNTLVLRVDGSGAPAFGDLLARVRETVVAAFAHQEVPFEKVVEEVQPERDLSRTPLFQVLFVLQNAGGEDLRLPGLTLTSLRTDAEVPAKVDLTLAIAETVGGLAGRLDYNVDFFDGPTIARLTEHWTTLLEAVAAAPEAPLADLPLLSAAERHQLLAEWGSRATVSRPETTEGLIAAQAARTPDAPALISPGGSVTYRELADRASRLASFLRSAGVGPDVRVAVVLDRSPELIIAFLAVLEAGGAYVPIDPTYPAERIDLLLEESAAPVVLTRESLSGLLPATQASLQESGGGHGGYVIYTSGSTGRPKGVLAGTAGLAAFASAMVETLGLGPGDRSLLFVTPAFDASAVTIYPTLVSGGALVLHPDPPSLSPAEILALAWEQELTVLDIPGSLWRQMVQEMASGAVPVPPVRAWLTGGEPLSVEALRQWAGAVREDAVFLSSYGPTEATVTTSVLVLSAREARSFRFDGAPIGRPLGAAEVLLLDATGRPAPIGVPGELLVGGPGVTRGYLGRPDLTSAAFRPHPLAGLGQREPGTRVYRTGDRARWRADGSLEFLGRGDQQIKIRGFRIEPGEIEEALMRHPGVGQAVAGIRETERGDRRLVAWVVPTPGASPGAAELRDFLRERLPEHMVPSALVLLDRFPLTASSKVDRRALPDPERAAEEGDFLAPVGEIEETLAAVWARLLGLERVGRQADFFALGGHSLLATQLVSRLREVFGVELPLRRVFEAPTLAALGQAVEQARRDLTPTAAPPLQPRPHLDGEPIPLSFAQERLWFIDQLQPGLATYNLPEAVRLTGPLDAAALERAFAEVVTRHEPLRTRFPVVAGAPVQEVDPPGVFTLPVVDLAALPEEMREGERDRLVRAEAGRPFDLARGPLLRAGLVRLGAREHVLALTLHHIVTDGWSMGVLIRELGTAYAAFARGARPVLPALPVRYADWAAWQRDWLRGEALDAQLAFWRERLGGEVPTLDLPLDHPRPPGDVIRGARQAVRVPAAVVTALETLGRGEEATLFMLLLAGFASLLHRLTGQDDLTVGTPVAGRTRAEVEGLVGLFLNTLALRTELAGDPPFRELVRRVRTVSLDAYSHQDLPFEKLVEELQPERVVGRTPFFQPMLVLQNAPAGELAAGDLTLAPVPSYNQTVRFDLTMSLTQSATGLTGWIEYKPDLLDATTVTRWVYGLVRLLAGAASDPGRRLSELPLLSDAERHQAVAEWNDTAAQEPLRPVCLHELFAEQAVRTPDAIAVDGPGEELTYRELERRAAGLARRILGRGIHPGERVAILMRPSPSRVAAVLAVLAAGAAYVPLDPASPRERLEQMLRDSGARLLLADEPLLLADEPLETAEIAVLIPGGSEAEGLTGLPSTAPGDLAYIVYTSGSTGTPKGVVIEHRQAVNTVLDINRRFGLGADDRVFAISALSFDLSVWDLFGTLAAGGTVVLPASEERPDPAAWSARMAAAGVTVWNSAPPLLDMLVESGAPLPPALRLALLSGDWIPVTLPGRVRRQVPGCRVVSLGGATEGSIWSILFPIGTVDPAWRSIPYGRPMQNQRFHVVDRHDHPVPVGVAGELRIGGAGVAVGYFGRPELTAERFVPDPFGQPGDQPGGRLYRTGDLGRFRADGTIEFLGRLDTQVKIRGFRVELGEIETVLSRHPGVREAVVLARQDGAAPAAGGDRRLVAYVVAASEGAPAAAELRAWLAARLPEFMVPPNVLFLEALPVTPNGKLDRRALPAPEAAPRERVAPRDAVEQHLAEIWERLLGIPDVGVHDNFFELGGHSLLATRLIAAVREELGVELPLREVFERPTVAGLALAVAERRVEGVAEDELARLLDGVQGLSDEEIELLLAGDEK